MEGYYIDELPEIFYEHAGMNGMHEAGGGGIAAVGPEDFFRL